MSNKIRKIREELGLTLEQVAEISGTSAQQIARLEVGDRRLTDDWMRRIAPALGVPPAALLADLAPNIPSVVQEAKKVRLRPDEIRLIRFWRALDAGEKRMIAAFARDKGLEILADQMKKRTG